MDAPPSPEPRALPLRPGDAARGIVARVEKLDPQWGLYVEVTREDGFSWRENGDAGLAAALLEDDDDPPVDWRPLLALLAEIRAARAMGPLTTAKVGAFIRRARRAVRGDTAAHADLRRSVPAMVRRVAAGV